MAITISIAIAMTIQTSINLARAIVIIFALKYYEYCTGSSVEDLADFKNRFKGATPRDMKRELACKIIESYHSKEDPQKAMEHFDQVFVKKTIPDKEYNKIFLNFESTLKEMSKLIF